MRQSCRTRSGMPCSGRRCTSAPPRRSAPSSTSKSAPHSKGSVLRALPWRQRSSPCISSAAASRWLRCATTRRARKPRLLNLVPAQCMALTQRGLSLLDQAPEGTERNALEIALATLWGTSATQLLGVTPEAKSAFQRAYMLLPGLPQHPMRRRLLYGFGLLLCLRAEYAEALAVAEQAESSRPQRTIPSLRWRHASCTARWTSCRDAGTPPANGPSAGSLSWSRWTSRRERSSCSIRR